MPRCPARMAAKRFPGSFERSGAFFCSFAVRHTAPDSAAIMRVKQQDKEWDACKAGIGDRLRGIAGRRRHWPAHGCAFAVDRRGDMQKSR